MSLDRWIVMAGSAVRLGLHFEGFSSHQNSCHGRNCELVLMLEVGHENLAGGLSLLNCRKEDPGFARFEWISKLLIGDSKDSCLVWVSPFWALSCQHYRGRRDH